MEAVKYYLQYQGQRGTDKQCQKLIKQLGYLIKQKYGLEEKINIFTKAGELTDSFNDLIKKPTN